jgi:hypothetical protein
VAIREMKEIVEKIGDGGDRRAAPLSPTAPYLLAIHVGTS